MDIVEITLLILSSYSIQGKLYSKAFNYSKLGFLLYPNNIYFKEIFCYACINTNHFDSIKEVLDSFEEPTKNFYYLKLRYALLSRDDKPLTHMQKYLEMSV